MISAICYLERSDQSQRHAVRTSGSHPDHCQMLYLIGNSDGRICSASGILYHHSVRARVRAAFNNRLTWSLRLAVRTSGSHPEDRGFESRRDHQSKSPILRWGFYFGEVSPRLEPAKRVRCSEDAYRSLLRARRSGKGQKPHPAGFVRSGVHRPSLPPFSN